MMPPARPKANHRRLPPILRKSDLESMSGYSKAAQGLFVLPWLIGVFTDSVISPGTLSRQLPDRSAFRAGRNFNLYARIFTQSPIAGGSGSFAQILAAAPCAAQQGKTFCTYRFSPHYKHLLHAKEITCPHVFAGLIVAYEFGLYHHPKNGMLNVKSLRLIINLLIVRRRHIITPTLRRSSAPFTGFPA